MSAKKTNISLFSAIEKLLNLFRMNLKKEKQYEWKVHHYNVISSISVYLCFELFLLFNIVDRKKIICIFSVKLCSFAILKVFLTQFWQLVFAVSNRLLNVLWYLWQKDDLLWVGSVTANLIREFSNIPMLVFI